MNEKLQDDLIKTYPKIFKNIGGDETKTCMAHGIQCNDGWYDLLDSLCYKISMHCMTQNTRQSPANKRSTPTRRPNQHMWT